MHRTLTPTDTPPAASYRPDPAAIPSDKLFALLVASVLDYAIFVLDARGRVARWNPGAERMTGYRESEVVGLPLSVFLLEDPESASRVQEEMDAAIRDGRAENEGWRVRKDGSRFWANTVLVALRDDHGELIGFGKIMRDLTEQRRLDAVVAAKVDELGRSNKELEQFAYVASHDLQEPLRMVTSYVQLLAKRYGGKLGADADDFIGYAVDGVGRMQQLINDLLAFSRVGTRGGTLQSTDAGAVLERVLEGLQITIQEAGATITHDPLPVVHADPSQLGQLLQNLIGNGIKFRGTAPPRVHIGVEPRGDHWLFTVRDNGIGFEAQYAERIFVIFQRLHGRGEYAGTGIGLAICRKIVERHGGQIWAASEPGRGSTFHFTWPGQPL